MRLRVLFPLACALTLTAASIAFASPQFTSTFAFTYSSNTPKSASGLVGISSWNDPGAPNGVPKGVVRIQLQFHPGTRLDTSALPRCRASDEDIANRSVRACPRSTMVGSVKGQGLIVTGSRFDTNATLFNARREIIVVVTLAGTSRLITYFRDDVGRSSISINFKVPGGVSLTRFEARLPRHSRKLRGKRRTYFRTPPTCPPTGLWTTTTIFTYRDGSTEPHSATTLCTPR
jgi:hypothetical protein